MADEKKKVQPAEEKVEEKQVESPKIIVIDYKDKDKVDWKNLPPGTSVVIK